MSIVFQERDDAKAGKKDSIKAKQNLNPEDINQGTINLKKNSLKPTRIESNSSVVMGYQNVWFIFFILIESR